MNQELEPVSKREEEEAALRVGYETLQRVVNERDVYKAQCESWEQANRLTQNENEMLRQMNRELEHRASFYMRHSTELAINLQNILDICSVAVAKAGDYVAQGLGLYGIQQIIQTTLTRAKDAAYRPTNAAPPAPQVAPRIGGDDGAPAPKFLTKPPEGFEEALRREE